MATEICPFTFKRGERTVKKVPKPELVLKTDLVPLLRVDDVLADFRAVAAMHGVKPIEISRPYALNVLHSLYAFCNKHSLQYLNAARFLNRTVYHMPATPRTTALLDLGQSLGSNTRRADFRALSVGTTWSEMFVLEAEFWAAFRRFGKDSSRGAIGVREGKRFYHVWEALRAIQTHALELKVDPVALVRYVLRVPVNDPQHLYHVLDFRWPKHRGEVAPARSTRAAKQTWVEAIGLRSDIKLTTIPLGFTLAREHRAFGGQLADIVEVTPSGSYRTMDGSVFQGEYWFCERRNPWLAIHIDETKFARIDPQTWYWPARHSDVPSVKELNEIDPGGAWTKVWDKVSGAPVSPLAGGIKLRK